MTGLTGEGPPQQEALMLHRQACTIINIISLILFQIFCCGAQEAVGKNQYFILFKKPVFNFGSTEIPYFP
jgi:hypothetical protein